MTRNIIANPQYQQVTVPISTVTIRRQIRHVRLHHLATQRANLPAIANHYVAMVPVVFATTPRTLTRKHSHNKAPN
ncbi:MAG: hypothetical protein NWF00_04855 [Candidatus Bathyarchaeota archaeon]|nr:hypothetical protein [Candidatus Bathyarchaeota archaeon]